MKKTAMAVRRCTTVAIASFASVLISCGGAQPPAEAPAGGGAAPASGAPAAAWKDMNHDQRMEFMKSTVLPKMKSEFAAYDATRFGSITCVTCHGDSVKDGSFKMPNPKLPKVPSDQAGFKKLGDDKPEAMKFMMSKVVPDMASMLGEQPFDPATGKGFGCHECHTDK